MVAISPARLKELKWSTFVEDEVISAKFMFLEGFRESTNPHGHGVMIYAERKPDITGYRLTEYTVVVSGGPYGETGDQITLPRRSTLAEAKAKAIWLATQYAEKGLLSE